MVHYQRETRAGSMATQLKELGINILLTVPFAVAFFAVFVLFAQVM